MNMLRVCAAVLLAVAIAAQAAFADGSSFFPDRRKPQFMNDRGYYVFPMPYSIPGVGEGVGVTAIGMNLGGTYTDVFGFALAGSLPGWGVGVSDVHLIPRTLILDLTSFQFGQSSITNYNQ
ncbi:MAG: hypothetical protein H6Q97_910, partial [Nitrospirae bacterium]|nr:hypothetical protein [Nitrospirota bacterium]